MRRPKIWSSSFEFADNTGHFMRWSTNGKLSSDWTVRCLADIIEPRGSALAELTAPFGLQLWRSLPGGQENAVASYDNTTWALKKIGKIHVKAVEPPRAFISRLGDELTPPRGAHLRRSLQPHEPADVDWIVASAMSVASELASLRRRAATIVDELTFISFATREVWQIGVSRAAAAT